MAFRAFKLRLTARFQSDIRAIPKDAAIQLLRHIDVFSLTGQGDIRKLEGVEQWRIRSGDYRACFTVTEDGYMVLSRAGHRREIYR